MPKPINGKIEPNGEATVSIVILDYRSGARASAAITAIIDTGFDGKLLMAEAVALQFLPAFKRGFTSGPLWTADGQCHVSARYIARLDWLSGPVLTTIAVLKPGPSRRTTRAATTMLGTLQLANCKLLIDFRNDSVEIDD